MKLTKKQTKNCADAQMPAESQKLILHKQEPCFFLAHLTLRANLNPAKLLRKHHPVANSSQIAGFTAMLPKK